VFDVLDSGGEACGMKITIKPIEASISKTLDPKTKKPDSSSVIATFEERNKSILEFSTVKIFPILLLLLPGLNVASIVFPI
jgi:hypothetical protein